MAESTVTFRVDEELRRAFSEAAKRDDRTGAQLLRDFMRSYVKRQQIKAAEEARFRAQVQEGLDDLAAGRVLPHEEVNAEFSALRAATRRRLGESG